MFRRKVGRVVAAAAVLAVAASACSTRASEGEDSSTQAGPGVTDDTIALGAMSDLSAVFATLGQTLVDGNRMYFDERNDDGGICGRQVELEVRDHAYNVQTAVTQFTELEPDVLGFVQLLGSPINAALTPMIAESDAITLPTTWSTDLLDQEAQVLTGSSYPTDIINGIEFLVNEGLVDEGATIGHIYFEGEYGSNALTGSEFAAAQLGMELVPAVADPSATDLAAQVNQLERADVDAILLSAGPGQTASVAGVASASGLDVPMLANAPGFDPALLETPVADLLAERLYVASSIEAFAGESETAQQIEASYAEQYPDNDPTIMVNYGYAAASVLGQALDQACENEDLTREGVLEAMRSLDAVETGVMPAMDMTDPATMPSTDSYVMQVDPEVPGGLSVVQDAATSPTAAAFNER